MSVKSFKSSVETAPKKGRIIFIWFEVVSYNGYHLKCINHKRGPESCRAHGIGEDNSVWTNRVAREYQVHSETCLTPDYNGYYL